MHIVTLVLLGLVFLAAFYFGARLMGRTPAQGAAVFLWVWLASSLLNAVVGVVHAGIPVINEVGALVPIFGIPAVVAWYLARRHATPPR